MPTRRPPPTEWRTARERMPAAHGTGRYGRGTKARYGGGRCACAASTRGWEVAGGYTSRASHVRNAADIRNTHESTRNSSLLGNHAQLCHAFYHIPPTPELAAFPGQVCLRCAAAPGDAPCAEKGVVVVAALRSAGGDLAFLRHVSRPYWPYIHVSRPH